MFLLTVVLFCWNYNMHVLLCIYNKRGATMNRTTIMLPEALKTKAMRVAVRRGISLGELIREGLVQACAESPSAKRDALFADTHVFAGEAPANLSVNHDDELY